MKMGRARRGVAGIIAVVIIFAILFTVGTSYYVFVEAQNAKYAESLLSAASRTQGSQAESMTVTTLLESNGDVGLFANDTSTLPVNMTAALIISSTGALLECLGVGFPAGAGCTNSTPTLPMSVNPDGGSKAIDTEYQYASGTTVTVKVLTARGNTYSATYPDSGSQSGSTQSVTVNLDNLKWVQLVPQASSLVQKKYVSNCNAAACAASFTSSVTAGNILVDAVGWGNQAPPSGVPTDTRGDSFTLGASSSVAAPSSPALVQSKYTSNCNAASCGLAFTSSVTSGNTLVYSLGWANQSPPSAPTDTRGDSFTLGSSNSVTVNPAAPSLVQQRYAANCNSATCALAYSSSVTAGNTLVLGLGWPSNQNYNYVPVTITNCQAPIALALDGSGYTSSGNPGTTITAALTTTQSNDVIIVIAYGQNSATNSFRTPSVSDTSGLSWTARSSLEEDGNTGDNGYKSSYSQIFYAIASSTLSSDSIKVTWSSAPTAGATIQVFGISGANTSSPFDTNSGLPAWASPGAWASVSTSSANDFIYGFENTASTQTPTTGSGWSSITSGVTNSYLAAEYQVVSSTQSSLSVSFSNAASDTNVDWGDAVVRATGCSASSLVALDGSTGSETESSSVSASLTTANANDVIVLAAGTSSSSYTVSSVSDAAGLTWTHRTSTSTTGVEEEEWYAIAASPLNSDSITVTWSHSGDNTMAAFGVSGANLAAPFDPNGSTPATATGTTTNPSVSVSTSYAQDLIFGLLANEHTSASVCHTETDANGWTDMNQDYCAQGGSTTQNNDQEYEVVSSTQSNLAISFSTSTGGSNAWAMIGDAIEGAPATATPSTFQQMVTWNPSTYSSYESSTLSNVRFCADSACNTLLYAWLESCVSSCTNTATSATAWVKLTSAISSGSSLTIYMVFEGTSVAFDGNYWGEAPTLSGTYGQYDNGANVFNFYDNFAGTTLSGTKWQTVIWGGGTISVNNGLTISATSTSYNPMLVSKNTYTPGVLESDMALTSKQTGQSTPTIFYATVLPGTTGGDAGFKTAYRFDWYQLNEFRIIADSGGSYASGQTSPYTLPSTYNIWSGTWSATGSESFAFNYAYQYVATDSHITYGSAYLGTAGVQGGTVNEYWIRLRATPPNNNMPITGFGSLTTGTGSPTSVSDTLGDSFTQAVAQSATVGSTVYESGIWYATASSSGADTITATFTASISGSISIYEISGYSASGVMSSTGSSTGGSTAASVGSFTPSSNSFVVGNVETGSSSTKYTVGAGYTTVASGAGGCDATHAAQGCDEYETGLGSATTTPFTLSGSTPWVDVAASFAPLPTSTYYSYVWYATAASTGADTISATFGQTVAGSVSIYEVSGVTATGLLSSTGGSASSQGTASVTSITPGAGSVVIGGAETTSTSYTAGTGYTLSGTCNSVSGCGEYETGVGSATTVPMSISPSAPWVEAAVAFAPTTTSYYSYIWYATAASLRGGHDHRHLRLDGGRLRLDLRDNGLHHVWGAFVHGQPVDGLDERLGDRVHARFGLFHIGQRGGLI